MVCSSLFELIKKQYLNSINSFLLWEALYNLRMKKNILGGIAILAIAVIIAININVNNGKISPLLLANIEALANESGGYSCTVTRDCGGGATVACTGTSECKHVSGPLGSISGRGVSCDGKVTRCP
jgi:hypothetical protein